METYFRINRIAPKLISANVFQHPKYQLVLKIKIISRRTQVQKDLSLAFQAAAAVANLSEKEFNLIWVEMLVDYKEFETVMAIAPAKCTIATFILQDTSVDYWKDTCLEFL